MRAQSPGTCPLIRKLVLYKISNIQHLLMDSSRSAVPGRHKKEREREKNFPGRGSCNYGNTPIHHTTNDGSSPSLYTR